MKLVLEMNKNFVEDKGIEDLAKQGILITPPLGEEDYWLFRVKLTKKQAIIGFPKFFTIGIGFEVEGDDWNTNLPYQCEAEEIYNHIKKNKGDSKITKAKCIKAIEMIQKEAAKLKEES